MRSAFVSLALPILYSGKMAAVSGLVALSCGAWPQLSIISKTNARQLAEVGVPPRDGYAEHVWLWDICPLWRSLHEENQGERFPRQKKHRVCQQLRQTWPRLVECHAVLYPIENPIPLLPEKGDDLDEALAKPLASTHCLMSIFYWAASNYTAKVGAKSRTWANRVAAANSLHGLLEGHLGRISAEYELLVHYGNQWRVVKVVEGRLNLHDCSWLHGDAEWEAFQSKWLHVLSLQGDTWLKKLSTHVEYPSIADLVYGLLLLCRFPADRQLCGMAVSVLGQIGNLLDHNMLSLFTPAAGTVATQHQYGSAYDRLGLGQWFAEFQTAREESGYLSLLDILAQAGVDRKASFNLATRIFKQGSQRILLRVRKDFAGCFKYSFALDKSKVPPAGAN